MSLIRSLALLALASILIFPGHAAAQSTVSMSEWSGLQQQAVKLLLARNDKDAEPILEKAAVLAAKLDNQFPEVAASYYELARMYWRTGLMYVVPPQGVGAPLQFELSSASSGVVSGNLLRTQVLLNAIEQQHRTPADSALFSPQPSAQAVFRIFELCNTATKAFKDIRKPDEPEFAISCTIAGNRVAFFDERVIQYFDRAISVWQRSSMFQKEHTNAMLEKFNFLIAIGRAKFVPATKQ